METLLTGASGFLGRHLLQALSQGEKPRAIALVRDLSAWEKLDWTHGLPQTRAVRGDLQSALSLAEGGAFPEVGAIVHLAATVHHSRHGAEGMAENIAGALKMVALADYLKCRLIVLSSSGVVGCSRTPGYAPDEEAPYAGKVVTRWPYYHSKMKMEVACQEEASRRGVALTIVRPPALQGPGDHRFRSTNHVANQMLGRIPIIPGGDIHILDVRDAAKSLAALVGLPSPRPLYHLPGHVKTLAEFGQDVERLSGFPRPTARIPHPLVWSAAWGAAQAARLIGRKRSWLPDPVIVEMGQCHWGISSRYASGDLGHSPRPWDETLADTISWLSVFHPEVAAKVGRRALTG